MGMSQTITLFAAAAGSRVDAEAGILRGVSIITEGEAKGHGILIDSTTLEQVKACIDAFGEDGVKVKVDHWSGFDGIVGTLRSAEIDGAQLRGDLHLLSNHDARQRILEMAEAMPSQFGLSIAFSGVAEQVSAKAEDGTETSATFARCTELFSVDLVDQPAANPTGLFCAPTEAELAFAASLDRIQALEAIETELRAKLEEQTQLSTRLSAEVADFKAREEKLAERVRLLKAARGLVAASVVPQVVTNSEENETDAELYERFQKAAPTEATRLLADPKFGPRIRTESARRHS